MKIVIKMFPNYCRCMTNILRIILLFSMVKDLLHTNNVYMSSHVGCQGWEREMGTDPDPRSYFEGFFYNFYTGILFIYVLSP